MLVGEQESESRCWLLQGTKLAEKLKAVDLSAKSGRAALSAVR